MRKPLPILGKVKPKTYPNLGRVIQVKAVDPPRFGDTSEFFQIADPPQNGEPLLYIAMWEGKIKGEEMKQDKSGNTSSGSGSYHRQAL